MSMISAQIDELREMAGKLESYDQGYGTICQALRDAADTIWQLRDDLQRANDAVRDAEHDESMAWDRVRKAETENAKLREYATKLEQDVIALDSDNTDLRDELHTLEEVWAETKSENAKLRELVADLHGLLDVFCASQDEHGDNCPVWVERTDQCLLRDAEDRVRELGIEVDDG